MTRTTHIPIGRDPSFIAMVRRMFESGMDTAAIAKATREPEPVVERALHRHKKENSHDENTAD